MTKKSTGQKKSDSIGGGTNVKDLPLDEVKQRLGFSQDGLTKDEAKKRLTQYGYNEIRQESDALSETLL